LQGILTSVHGRLKEIEGALSRENTLHQLGGDRVTELGDELNKAISRYRAFPASNATEKEILSRYTEMEGKCDELYKALGIPVPKRRSPSADRSSQGANAAIDAIKF